MSISVQELKTVEGKSKALFKAPLLLFLDQFCLVIGSVVAHKRSCQQFYLSEIDSVECSE